LSSLELPVDSRSDEISIQILDCPNCGFKGLGVYEESGRGSIDSDSFHHRGYVVDSSVLESLREKMLRCCQPGIPRCDCSAHEYFHRVDENGRWNFLKVIEIKSTFQIQIT
jgi:hypothetical protein